ncbi:MAG TPA: hypothetical protein VF574_15475 [Allosphingosinicella sp.]
MRNRILMVALATAGMTVGYATPAAAQATRTWVSGVGDDVNPCSRTAPCKTFAGAISKTAAGGEINCLDPGGFGAVSINKSLVIDCHYTEGGALAGGNGITVNDSLSATPNTAVVVIRGLDIFGVNPPSNGVRFVAGLSLHIEDCVIRRFNAANSAGVSFAPGTAANLFISDSRITQNGNGATGGGIVIAPTAGGSVRVVMTRVQVQDNANVGIKIDSTATASANGMLTTIADSEISGNPTGLNATGGGTGNNVMVTRSTIAINGTGVNTNGATAVVRIGTTNISSNQTGITASGGGTNRSFGDNQVIGNLSDGTFNGAGLTEI